MTYRIWQQEKKSYIKPSPETNNNFHLQKSRHCGVYATYLNLLWVKKQKSSNRMRGGRGVVVLVSGYTVVEES